MSPHEFAIDGVTCRMRQIKKRAVPDESPPFSFVTASGADETISPASFHLAQSMGKNERPFYHSGRGAANTVPGDRFFALAWLLQPPKSAEKDLTLQSI
jgi:hypothetical protein